MNFKAFSVITLAVGTLGVSSLAHADNYFDFNHPAVYVGLQGGYGEVDYGDNFKAHFQGTSSSIDEDGIAGRGYIGVQFNPYLGLEGGYSRFSDNTYRIHAANSQGERINIDTKFETQQADALLKIGTPFGCSGFRGDIKLGGAYVMTDANTHANASANLHSLTQNIAESEDTLVPAAGASLSYHLNKNIALDISYLHAFGKGKIDSPTTDLTTVGISYLFA